MLRRAGDHDTLTVPNYQFGVHSWAELLAYVTPHAIEKALHQNELAGLYRCLVNGVMTLHGYARFMLAQAQAQGWTLKAGPAQVLPTPTASYPTPAQRPLNSRLDTTRLQNAFGLTLPPWQQGVARMLTEITGKT